MDRAELADGLVALAALVAYRNSRAILLCTAVVLREARTTATAQRWVTTWDGPPGIKDAVLRLLDLLDPACAEIERKAA